MKLEDLLRMAFNDGKRYGQGNTNLNFKQHFESTEYVESIKLVKNCSISDVVGQSEQFFAFTDWYFEKDKEIAEALRSEFEYWLKNKGK